MNILEVSFLVADLSILIGGFVIINRFKKREKKDDNHYEMISTLNEKIFQLESFQRYENKWQIDELKNKQDILEVKISKLSSDLSAFKFQIHTKNQAETLVKNVFKYMEDENELDSNEIDSTKTHETKPSESFKNEVVQVIRKDTNEILKLTRKVGRKYEKSKVKVDDIEIAFRTKFGMTFYGYRQKYGEEAFKKARYDAYQRAYYLNVKKQKLITKK